MRRVRRAALALGLLALASCGRACHCGAPASVDAASDDDPPDEAGPKLGAGELAPERCKLDGAALVVSNATAELGRAEARPTGEVTFGITTNAGAEVVTVAAPADAPLRLVDRVALGRLAGDAPPPRAFGVGLATWAVFYPAAGDAGTKRALRVVALDGTPRTARVVAEGPPESLDESLAYDAAAAPDGAALLAWDDDEHDRGVIRVAVLRDGKLGEPKTISQTKGDASAPRVLATDGGWVVAWKARRDETQPDGSAKLPQDNELEGPGELRGFDWIEGVRLGKDGAPLGAPVKLVPDGGHVAGFDLGAAAVPGAFDVYARDASQRGKLLHVAWKADGAAPPVTLDLPPGVVGVPSLFGALLFWDDVTSRTLAVPLDPATGEPAGKASDESAAAQGSVLSALPGVPSRLLVVLDPAGGGGAASLRAAICPH